MGYGIGKLIKLKSVHHQKCAFTFVSERVEANVTAERLSTRVLAVVIIQLGLRLEALSTDITHKFAFARVKLGVTS